MSELLQGWKRTCYCTELGKADVGREVTLMGWCNVRRDLGALIFVLTRSPGAFAYGAPAVLLLLLPFFL